MHATAIIPERTVLGHCSCPGLLLEAAKAIPEEGPVTVMVPPVTPDLEPAAGALICRLKNRPDTELSLNDWGTLTCCSRMKKEGALRADLTAGVLLSGQDTDPLLSSFYHPQPAGLVYAGGEEDAPLKAVWAPPSKTLTRHWRTPSIFALAELLKQLGVSRIELSGQALPLPEEGPGLPVTLIREAVVSIFPCRHDCRTCSGPDIRRGHVMLHHERNMLFVSLPEEIRPWIDRVLTIAGGCKDELQYDHTDF